MRQAKPRPTCNTYRWGARDPTPRFTSVSPAVMSPHLARERSRLPSHLDRVRMNGFGTRSENPRIQAWLRGERWRLWRLFRFHTHQLRARCHRLYLAHGQTIGRRLSSSCLVWWCLSRGALTFGGWATLPPCRGKHFGLFRVRIFAAGEDAGVESSRGVVEWDAASLSIVQVDDSIWVPDPACTRSLRRTGKSGSCSTPTISHPRRDRVSPDSCACSSASRSSSSRSTH